MKKEEFKTFIEKSARAYAIETVQDPDNHMDAVECIEADYLEGAWDAYEILTKDED